MRSHAVLCLLVLASCAEDGLSARSVPPAFDGALARIGDALCRASFDRCTPPNADYVLDLCRARFAGAGGFADDARKAIVAGRARFDATAVQPCIDALDHVVCTQRRWPARLETDAGIGDVPSGVYAAWLGCRFLIPEVAEGQPCYLRQECVGGFCDGDCPGTCRPFIPIGDACLPDSTGPDCDSSTGEAYCSDQTFRCTPRLGEGDSCWSIDQGYDPPDEPCIDGLTCVRQSQCEPPGAAGAPCGGGPSDECAEGFYCRGYSPITNTTGSCVAAAAEDQPCGPSWQIGDLPVCQPGLLCNQATGTCTRASDIGEVCYPSQGRPGDTGCKLGLACVGGMCQLPPDIGQPCGPMEQPCRPGAYCQSGSCAAQLPVGAPCDGLDKYSACYDGKCVNGQCSEWDLSTCHVP